MKKTTLAVPQGHPAVDALIAEAGVSGRSVATLSVGEPAPDGPVPSAPWNPLSFASSMAAITEAETMLGGAMDELVIFADPPADAPSLVDLAPRDIEAAAQTWAAGHAELMREAMRRFGQKGGGAVVLVVRAAARGPLGAMAAGALLGLAEGILESSSGQAAGMRFMALRDESGQADLVARQVVRILDEPPKDASKVMRFGGRTGLFGRP